jgi:hypothetical protein
VTVGYVEVEQFALAAGVGAEEFVGRDAAMQAWSYVHRPGLLRRTTARGDGGEVLVLTLHSGAGAPEPLASRSPDDPLAAFTAAIDASTYRRSVYRDLG